jgi:hypothetical protein
MLALSANPYEVGTPVPESALSRVAAPAFSIAARRGLSQAEPPGARDDSPLGDVEQRP